MLSPTFLLTVLSALGLSLTGLLMWRSPHGVPGLRQLDSAFQLPDMRFFYKPATLWDTFERLGAQGRAKLRRFWLIDGGFIICLMGVQWVITRHFAQMPWLRTLMLGLLVLRAVLDALENILLSIACARYPRRLHRTATLGGYTTSAKFVALYGWLGGLFICLFMQAVKISGA